MTRLVWGTAGNRLYEAGLDRGVLYVDGQTGVPWNGLTAIAEAGIGGELRSHVMDGQIYMETFGPQDFKARLSAFYSPPEFDECDGISALDRGFYAVGQRRKSFGLSYRTGLGNDVDDLEYGYKIHIIYNCLAEVSNRSYSTVNSSTSLSSLSWNISAKPIYLDGKLPTAHFYIDTSKTFPWVISAIEGILYGSESAAPRLPTIQELQEAFDAATALYIVDNGDGTITLTSSDELGILTMLDATTLQINSESLVFTNSTTFTISSI